MTQPGEEGPKGTLALLGQVKNLPQNASAFRRALDLT